MKCVSSMKDLAMERRLSMKSSLVILGALTLTLAGCAVHMKTISEPGQNYGIEGGACVNMPDLADKVKEGLGKSKVCAEGHAHIHVQPK